MTTTAEFQRKPDFFLSKEKCMASKRDKPQTNPRYRDFTQTNFTAGDAEQFETYRNATNSTDPCEQVQTPEDNIFAGTPFKEWEGYKDLRATSVQNTFSYIFEKFKKGIFVKIVNNQLNVFLPFSKHHFCNEWGDRINIDPKYGDMLSFLRFVSTQEGYRFFPHKVNTNTDTWFGNNCLVRYEKPLSEGENNVTNVKNMLETLCATRKVPDIEFFVNRRDFPLLTRDGTEAYNHIWDSTDQPLVSHAYSQYSPILSMCTSDKYADHTLPTHEDWARVQSGKKWFPPNCKTYPQQFPTLWADKKPTAMFRGGTTGCGVSITTNPRLALAHLSSITPVPADGIPYLDAGVTKWNIRPRKVQGEKYLTTIDPKAMPFGLASELTSEEQSKYKYIINVDGHVAAFRLSLELNMGSVILMIDSSWKIWYRDMLEPWIHYIPVKKDLSDLIDQIKWCRDNDEKCEQIAQNARDFYIKYLQEDGILDYTQKLLVDLKIETGLYLYNKTTPLNLLVSDEFKSLTYKYPETTQLTTSIHTIPSSSRNYGLLKGVEWVVNMSIKNGGFEKAAGKETELFSNKLSKVYSTSIANFPLVRKTTDDFRKAREHVHETFIGTKSINHLLNKIPNFAYTFAGYDTDNGFSVITEKIHGQMLHDYLMSPEFQMNEFISILVQICLALKVAQDTCALVHYDLTPWNIILQRSKTPIKFDYVIDSETTYRVSTSVVPIIIDYGKSHVVYNGEHHGFINMYNVSTIQDVLTILLTSMKQISDRRIPQSDFSTLIKLANFLSNTGYRREQFNSAFDLKNFLHDNCHYTKMTTIDKQDLEKKGPMDLIEYIRTHIKYPSTLTKTDTYSNIMDGGNARQVFDFILSDTDQERLKSYTDVFQRVRECSIPKPTNLFFVHYAAQMLDKSLRSVRKGFELFTKRSGMDTGDTLSIIKETTSHIRKMYEKMIKENSILDIEYAVVNAKTLVRAPYTEETFLDPGKISSLVMPYHDNDLAEYKDMVMQVLSDTGHFSLSDPHKQHYKKNFARLLKADSLNMQNNSANLKTLNSTAQSLYSVNLEILEDTKCDNVENYKKLYIQVLVQIK
jgi:hypothetical protein